MTDDSAPPLRHATRHLPAGSWSIDRAVATVTLDYDSRYRRRLRLTDDDGHPFLLNLARPVRMAPGDGLALDGSSGVIAVAAASEPVLEVGTGDPAQLARFAWHLGNRHLPVQVLNDGRLRIRFDHVIRDMLTELGGTPVATDEPFAPEAGA